VLLIVVLLLLHLHHRRHLVVLVRQLVLYPQTKLVQLEPLLAVVLAGHFRRQLVGLHFDIQ
jgi:hypothetical protein